MRPAELAHVDFHHTRQWAIDRVGPAGRSGEAILLTRDGQEVVRLVSVKAVLQPEARRMLLDAVRMSGAAKATAGPDAARSQDFLYGEEGLPE